LVEMPSPHLRHQKLYRALVRFLERWLENGGHGLLYYQPVDLRISGYRSLIPDLSYFQSNDPHAVEHESGNYLTAAPDLVVEIISPSTEKSDRVYKFRVYAEIGVRYYWIIDPLARVFQAFKLENGSYQFEANLADEGEFAPELFPNLVLPMPEIFGPPEPIDPETLETNEVDERNR
jgi:Uma2 family endonuclease